MSFPIDNSTFILTNVAGGVDLDISIDIKLSVSGGPYSQLYLENIDMTIQRSDTEGGTYSDIATYTLAGISGISHTGNYGHVDNTAVSGNTYFYRLKNTTSHFEIQGAPE